MQESNQHYVGVKVCVGSSPRSQANQHRIVGLVEISAASAKVLNPDGAFLAKVFQSGADAELLAQLKRDFAVVKPVKLAAGRQDSSER